MSDTARETYRFEPLNRRGLVLGVGAGQLGLVVGSVVLAVAAVRTWPRASGFAAAAAVLAAAAAMCRPVGGRPPLQWLALGGRYLLRARSTREAPPGQAFEVAAPPAGEIAQAKASLRAAPAKFPARTPATGIWLDRLPAQAGLGPLGALVDAREGTVAAVLQARGASFCLLDNADKERRLAAWAGVLEALCSASGSIARLQWCQRARAASSDPLVAHLLATGDSSSPGYSGHLEHLRATSERAWRHETFLVVVMHAQLRGRRVVAPDDAHLRNELRSFRAQLRNVGVACDGVLDATDLARSVGAFLVPGLDRHDYGHPWPLSFEERWGELRADGQWYRTYWVGEWPRSSVGPDFLSQLLLGKGRRCVSVVMAPVPPEKAARDAESSRTAEVADARLRAQGGFLETARQRRQAEALEGRESNLAEGRGAFSFSGYISVAAGELPELEQASSELHRAAAAARILLRPLYGQQREALMWALPFGRGL
ncbi:MAG TPA: SCO6880 family protein [Acidimicrobiales bacterium]|nr:SCO6880 family protein [Acidimicrobiales bacterium]